MRYLYISLILTNLALTAPAQIISTVCGNGTGAYAGDGGAATAAELYFPTGIAVDASGNLYIADFGNSRIREVGVTGIITTIAGNGTGSFSGDGGQATNATLNAAEEIILDAADNLYIADNGNNRIRVITKTTNIINTVAGGGTSGLGDGGQATLAALSVPYGVVTDISGNIYIVDTGNNRVRKVNTNGIIGTLAGIGTANYSGDGGNATAAELNAPNGLTIDAVGNVYIADAGNNVIRKVNTMGVITTIVGNGTGAGSGFGGYSGDGGQSTAAELNYPTGVILDGVGNIYIADYYNARIRKVNTSSGIITTIAGNGTQGYSGDGGNATAAKLNYPFSVTFDMHDNLYIADSQNNRIRKVTNVGQAGIQQVAGSNMQVNIYPNPASTSLTLTLSKGEGTSTLLITDMLGNAIYHSTLNTQHNTISVADLAEGVYTISITSNDGVVNRRLVIVR